MFAKLVAKKYMDKLKKIYMHKFPKKNILTNKADSSLAGWQLAPHWLMSKVVGR